MSDRFETVCKNGHYKAIYDHGKKWVGRYFVLYVMENGLGYNRFGIVASKRVGKAVVRNKAKRRIRALLKELSHSLQTGRDCVLIARQGLAESNYEDLRSDCRRLFKRAGLTVNRDDQ